jgi:hypothetical protein
MQRKNLDQQIDVLDIRYPMEYHPDTVPVNERNLAPIIVLQNQGYEVDNGLLGVKRDIFNKLGTHLWSNDGDLQQRYGISSGQIP